MHKVINKTQQFIESAMLVLLMEVIYEVHR
jgi:hypothetical protein